ncbi:YceI family protein [Flagellimonas meridianipacifica]|uniref:Polyisoprenoid-binding protein YceI n=1 Tax=Flagellimonas meridianipacifica TaxID=1080225 RepID=A0A2T0MK17_9FLAO|nr:YceI family protein [Allomuricauda pacifica]PRX57913.1 polyisoprenoid-binding protein YceI [Allomuricauda pacifica]
MKNLKNTLILVFAISILGGYTANAQSKYIDKKGKIVFEASEKLFEEVKAQTESATAIFDSETNQIASLALVKGFRFKNSLMQEHFNENYIESDTYPKATFKGKLIDFDASKLSETPSQVSVDGKMKLHGKEKDIRTDLLIYKKDDSIVMEGGFKVKPEDFDISIPKIVRNKIAKEVLVQINFNLIKK